MFDDFEFSEIALILSEIENLENNRRLENKLSSMYPDEGEYKRDLYPKHMKFFNSTTRERLFVAGNRCGKSVAGSYEATCHLTGFYPKWWEGKRFDRPVRGWVAGDTNESTRDIIQRQLLGEVIGRGGSGNKIVNGQGMIPRQCIDSTTWKSGVPDLVDTVRIRHVSGKCSTLGFKTYAQGRLAFQGTEQDFIWFDEECPLDVYTEALLRTATTNGIIYTTFTPLKGLTKMVLAFLPNATIDEGESGSKTVVSMTWDEVPHLTDQAKEELLSAMTPNERDARTKGVPSLGAGAIYPVPESDIVCAPFQFPEYWTKSYALDVGWNRTACLWGAWDRDNDIVYLYSEHYMGSAEPSVHAQAIRARGDWIQGVIDPASRGRSQKDGDQLFQIYTDLGLHLTPAKNAVEAGIYEVWQRLSTGRLKVFSTLQNFLTEYRLYRRDEKGKIVKDGDHLVDCARYLVMSGLDVSMYKPIANPKKNTIVLDYKPF